MGNNSIRFKDEDIRGLEEATPFNRAEIEHSFKIFKEMYQKYVVDHENGELPPDMAPSTEPVERNGIANPEGNLPVDFIVEKFDKLQFNPFRKQICLTFCTSDGRLMSFTEFIDMVSSFSPKADLEKKIFHAFQIFDFDGDGLINRNDLYTMIDKMTNKENVSGEDWEKTKKWIVDGVFHECHKGADCDQPTGSTVAQSSTANVYSRSMESLTIEDFKYCIYRSPDFINTFSFNL